MLSLSKVRSSRVLPAMVLLGAMAVGYLPWIPMLDPTKRYRSARESHITLPHEPHPDPREARRKRKALRPAWRK